MRALIKDKPVRGATLADLPLPVVGEEELLVRVEAAAICGTDIHIYQWNDYAASHIRLPLLFGHEYAAEVVEVGKRVKNFRPGDRVAAETHVPCGHCFQCTTGLQHVCRDMKILGVHVPGAFSGAHAPPETSPLWATHQRFNAALSAAGGHPGAVDRNRATAGAAGGPLDGRRAANGQPHANSSANAYPFPNAHAQAASGDPNAHATIAKHARGTGAQKQPEHHQNARCTARMGAWQWYTLAHRRWRGALGKRHAAGV